MSDENQNNDQAPKSVEQLLSQVEAKINKEKMESFKGVLTNLVKKKQEAERSVALAQAEIDEAIAKFKAGRV